LAGGLIGALAAANEELLPNDVRMNVLVFFAVWTIMLLTYRSPTAGFYLLAPLVLASLLVHAYMAISNTGIHLHTLPLIAVGIGFGIGPGVYILQRTIAAIRVRGELVDAVREALVTSGRAVTFAAATILGSAIFWLTSNIRFNADMGLLLAVWMGISCVGCLTLMPALIVVFKPQFIMNEADRPGSSRWAMDNSTPI
jgi:predicted RND superfamily exporter protein